MSELECVVEIISPNPDNMYLINRVMKGLDSIMEENSYSVSYEDTVTIKIPEEQFATELIHKIWKANGEFCKVIVTLKPIDSTEYTQTRKDYKKWAS